MDPYEKETDIAVKTSTGMIPIESSNLSLFTSHLEGAMSPVTTAQSIHMPQHTVASTTGYSVDIDICGLDISEVKQVNPEANMLTVVDEGIETLLSEICKNDLLGGNLSSVLADQADPSQETSFGNMTTNEEQQDALNEKISHLLNVASSSFNSESELPPIETLINPIFESVDEREGVNLGYDGNIPEPHDFNEPTNLQNPIHESDSIENPEITFDKISKSPTNAQMSTSAQVKPESFTLALYRRGRPGRKPLPGGPKRKRTYTEKGTEEYLIKRARNNLAIRKCREKAKQKQTEMELKMQELEEENCILRQKLEIVTQELNELKGKPK